MRKTIWIFVIAISLLAGRETGARYLVITHDNFYDAVLPLAQWKHRKGVRTKVVRLSEIGSTETLIRAYIVNAYNNWTIRPEFVLLVGAPNYIPFPTIGTKTDNYYTNMNGDIYNEILSGRLTVHSPTEAQTVVNKILTYERSPETADSTWYYKSVLIANQDYDDSDSIYWENVHYFARLMTENGYTQIDTLSDYYGDDRTDVINGVDAGRAFVLYRGCGLNNWSPPFDCNADLAANGKKLPIVLSMTCCCLGTGSMPAAAEKWFLTGSPTNPRGACAYFSTTTAIGNGAHLRSAVAKGVADAIFVDYKKTFGEACENGRKRVYQMYGATNEYRGWTTVGDPEMNIWIHYPRPAVVLHTPILHLGSNIITVHVEAGGVPVYGAAVCALQRDTLIYATGITDATGDLGLPVTVAVLDTVFLTITGRTMLPYETCLLVSPDGGYVNYLKHAIDDSTGGNANGRVNPGESVGLPVWVKNYGSDTTAGVAGLLTTAAAEVTMFDSLASFHDIPPGDSALSDPPFRFAVDSFCPDNYRIDFNLFCADTGDTWPSQFSLLVAAPRLDYELSTITGGNGNPVLDPGETVDLIVAVRNEGSEQADTARAVCRSASPDIQIPDSTARYPVIKPDSVGDNTADPFVITADSTVPIGTSIDFEIVISTVFSSDTLAFSVTVGKKEFYVWNPSQHAPPGLAVYSTLAALGYTGEYGTELPAGLNYYRAAFVCLGAFPNNYRIPAESSEAAVLVDFLGNGGRLYLEGGDVWAYDPHYGGYDFAPLFSLTPTSDGFHDMGPLNGQTGTFTAGMQFAYAGDNMYMDHISPLGSARLVFRDANDGYDCGVAYNAGNYRTVGTSFELGALVDGGGASTKSVLLDSIMHFFGIGVAVGESRDRAGLVSEPGFGFWPNPARGRVRIRYTLPAGQTGIIRIYDETGRLVKIFDRLAGVKSINELTWRGIDETGRQVAAGVYFIKYTAAGKDVLEKAILVR